MPSGSGGVPAGGSGIEGPAFKIENQLCYLVHRLDQAILARYRPLLDELGITYTQYMALLVLWDRGEQTVGSLCAAMDLDTGTVSPLVKRLEKAGYVERQRDVRDERSVRIRLTLAGLGLRERIEHIPGSIASCVLSGGGEYTEVRGLLERLLERLQGASCAASPLPESCGPDSSRG